MKQNLLCDLALEEPKDYLRGTGDASLPTPQNILFFRRRSKQKLQQEAIQNKCHHRAVLVINLETQGDLQLDNLTIPFKPQQAVLIQPHQFHHFSGLESPTLNWLFCTFEIQDPSFVEALRNQVVDISSNTWELFTKTFEAWNGSEKTHLHKDLIQSYLLSAIISLKLDKPAPKSLQLGVDDQVSQVNRIIHGAPTSELSIAYIATKVGLSESRMRSVFKQAAGVSLGQYLLNYKLHLAISLLESSQLTVSEIAHESGFHSIQSFSRAFKTKIGQSPNNFKKRHSKLD
jgi:AraC family transcriptional regulator of arabinose operon